MFSIIILTRILFAASMVFIIGYIFGSFSKSSLLTRITKIAAILAIVLFIFTNVLSFRSGGWYYGNRGYRSHCGYYGDSTRAR